MQHRQARGAPHRSALAAALALIISAGSVGVADATGLVPAGADPTVARQSSFDPRPGPAESPGTFQSSGPVDVSLAVLGLDPLPISVAAGQGVSISAQVPTGSTCFGSLALPGKPWQPLDDVATRTGDCAWDVPVPLGSRPGNLAVTVDVSRGSQGRRLYGVVYVDVTHVGSTDSTARNRLA